MMAKKRRIAPVYTTQPSMPDLDDYTVILRKIWKTKWLTNNGVYHQRLEKEIADFLGVHYCSLFCNGTLALMIGIKALGLKGSVITTPFTFPATIHVLHWLNIRPIYCDIDETTCNLDVSIIEPLIAEDTSAVLPVHVYGRPCDVVSIERLARRHNLRVIYDAAHAFGVRVKGESLMNFGDISMVSFHATKLYTTLEGGALFCSDKTLKQEFDRLKNFGILDEETVAAAGINAKMNELQAAFGLLHLKMVNSEIQKRQRIAELYRKRLREIPGFVMFGDIAGVQHNYAYFPVRIKKDEFRMTRDALYSFLKKNKVNTRKYFYPLATSYGYVTNQQRRHQPQLPVADRVSREVLCLPIYGNLELKIVNRICNLIWYAHERAVRKKPGGRGRAL